MDLVHRVANCESWRYFYLTMLISFFISLFIFCSNKQRRFFYFFFFNMTRLIRTPTIICVTYRPDDSPLSSFEEVLKPSYIQALLFDKPITIIGDLNCDGLKKTGPEFKALEKFYTDMNLKQLITKLRWPIRDMESYSFY